MRFARYNRIELIELLLAVPGIEVNAKDNDNWSALLFAVQCRYFNIAGLLLSHGAAVDSSDVFLYFNRIGRWSFITTNLIRFLSLLLAHQSKTTRH
jgi:ankyrin repeat protein